jgi:hypothetical protein
MVVPQFELNAATAAAFIVGGAVLGLAIGFVVHKITGGFGDFVMWTPADRPGEAVVWTIGGAAFGAVIGYFRARNSN